MGFFQKLLVGTFETIAQPMQDKQMSLWKICGTNYKSYLIFFNQRLN